jgi:hypothetical protein
MQEQSKRKGITNVAVDNDFFIEIDNFKKKLEGHLGRRVSYPFTTNLMKNLLPKEIKIKKVLINDGKRRNRTIQIVIEYLMEEI